MRTAPPSALGSPRGSSLSVVAIIPARFKASRLPGKPLAEIGGKPLIEHVYRRTAATPGLERVLVATDDERIAEAVRGFGGEVCMTRADHRSGTDRLAEVAATLTCDVVVNVQGDEPLIEPAMIAQAIHPFAEEPGVSLTTLRRRLASLEDYRSPHVVKVVVDRQDFALYFSRAPIPHWRDGGPEAVPASCYKHIGLYAYRRTTLLEIAALPPTPLEVLESLEQLRALEHGYRMKAVETPFDSIGVDTPADLERVRQHVQSHLPT